MKSSTKSSIRNLLVTLVLTSSAVFFGWLFWTELNRTVDNVDGKVVGEVVEIRGQAQRRYDKQSRWGSLKGSEQVYNLDAIRTSSESGAVIVLKTIEDDIEVFDEISLGPDTYIILDLFGATRNINFVGGDLSATGAQGLTVSAEGTLVAVDKGSVNLNREAGEQTSVTVTEGEATVNTGGGSTVVGTESILRINEISGAAIREEVALKVIEPKPNALLLSYDEQRRVDFQWELFADWADPVLEVSTKPGFRDADGEVQRIPSSADASLQLGPGLWYWRVINTANGESGPTNVFSVDTERRALPTSPVPDLVIPFRGIAPAVSLQWNRAWFADSYKLELARTPSFTEVLIDRELTGSSVLVENLSAGNWWWRITPLYRRGILDRPVIPDSRAFVLEQRIGHDPVTLISPADNAEISAMDVRDGVPFRWQSINDLISYRVKVAQDPEFILLLADSDGPENWRTLLPALEPETYYWRLEAAASDGLPVPVSEVRSFTIHPVSGSVELIDPAPGETKELEPYTPHTFLWRSAVPGIARFQLDRINEETGSSVSTERTRIIESLVNGESFTAPLPGEGSYVWQVRILDENGRTLRESAESIFRLRSEFSPPVLNNPRPGSNLSLVGSSAVTVAWDPSPGADAYRVVLKSPNGAILARDDRAERLDRDFSISAAGGTGTYSVELTSIRDVPPPGGSRTSETATYRFEVGDFVEYSAAVPVAPANGAVISGLNSLVNGVTLRWNQDPPLGRYTVEIENGSVTRLYQTSEPVLDLDALDSGTYRWTVRSRDSFGQDAPDSRISRFVVEELPTPARPTVTFPESGGNIDMTGRRDLVFDWQPVSGADFYDLALYVEGSGTPILRKNGHIGTRYTLENLRILDEGNFILSIQARSEYAEVGVSRSSTETRVPFSLSVNIADTAPTILTNELQYAE